MADNSLTGRDQRAMTAESQFNDERSPFRPPNDEEVFVTRETEK